jgi:succinate-semialdehyde dehydrogenase/glutarate-semialdehyde dehydrogenase
VRSDEDAIALANDTAYGLNASIWSRDVRAARALARRIRAGTVNINDGYAAAWGASGAPMGGMGQSGLGRRHGPEGITKYTESQTIAAQHLVPIAPFGGLDDRQFATALTVGLKLLRRAGLR